MLLNEKSKFTDKEIIEKGSRALIKELDTLDFYDSYAIPKE